MECEARSSFVFICSGLLLVLFQNNNRFEKQQRIAIARALYKDASIFIFDEVTNNLDSYSREQTLKAISLLKDAGKTAIFITHKEDELKLCDRVYSLENKNLVSL